MEYSGFSHYQLSPNERQITRVSTRVVKPKASSKAGGRSYSQRSKLSSVLRRAIGVRLESGGQMQYRLCRRDCGAMSPARCGSSNVEHSST
ncbi:hypothetical protein NPIL_537061 [Nephila pilipes]|uniref:Uncharacterized protein n=1 Tax=Nephila pilipes TaxID=299642 RepID=A0A8X6U2V8_NEPPI|nr:hypothetical protein NPIL_537061 [Nephila pilipes]